MMQTLPALLVATALLVVPALAWGSPQEQGFDPALAFAPLDSIPGGDERWSDRFMPPGPVGPAGAGFPSSVSAFSYQDRIVVCGEFAWMDGESIENAAAWNGTEWEPFPLAPEDRFHRILTLNGRFFSTGDTYEGQASPISEWSGTTWVPFPWTTEPEQEGSDFELLGLVDGSPFGLRRDAYEVVRDSVFYTYRFEHSLQRWNGNGWDLMNQGIASGLPDASLQYGDDLLICGDFHLDDPDSTRGLARWTGEKWAAFAGSANGRVTGLVAGPNGLVASGPFGRIGGTDASGIARWDGVRWFPLGAGLVDSTGPPRVRTAAFSGDTLYVAGGFTEAGGHPADGLAFWDGGAWHTLRSTASGQKGSYVTSLLSLQGEIYAFGYMKAFHDPRRSTALLRRWNGSFWDLPRVPGARPVAPITALCTEGNLLYAGGEFHLRDLPETVYTVASWDGVSWTPIGDPMDDEILAVSVYRGRLIAAGSFRHIGDREVAGIAMWNGLGWVPLQGGADQDVTCLAVFRDQLIAGGGFRHIAGQEMNRIASWDGIRWSPLGEGLAGGWVRDMIEHDGKLAVCGNFDWAGGRRTLPVALWDGSSWTTIDPGPRFGFFNRVASFRGRLLLGSGTWWVQAQDSSERDAWSLAEWNGEEILPLKGHPFAEIYEMARFGPYLVVSGRTSVPEDGSQRSMDSLLFFDGYQWVSSSGRGVWTGVDGHSSGEVMSLASDGNRLFVGGDFWFATDIPSFYIAEWDGPPLPAPRPPLHLAAVPNPAREAAVLTWTLERPGPLDLRIFDLRGRLVARPASGPRPAGSGSETWDLRDLRGIRVPAGIYFARAATPEGKAIRKIVVLP